MKKKNRNKRVRFRRLPVAPCAGILRYCLLIAACAVFAEAFRSPVSAMVMWFVLLLPAVDLLCLGISFFFVTVTVEGKDCVITRGDRLTVPIRIGNKGLLPVSCVEMTLSVPEADSLRSHVVAERISLPPFTSAATGISIGFSCRGFFLVGVEEIFLFDLLRLIRIRKRIRRRIAVRVLPRRLPAVGGLPPFLYGGESRRQTMERNAADYGDVRQYRPGDGIKNIHWKLSTKLDELQVRKHDTESEKELRIFLDFAPPAKSGKRKDAFLSSVENGLAEEALSAACDAARQGAAGLLSWYGPDGALRSCTFADEASAEALAFPLSEAEGGKGDLPEDLSDREGMSVLYVTACYGTETEARIRRAASLCGGLPFAVLLLPLSEIPSFEETEEQASAVAELCRRLAESGIGVTVIRRKEVPTA